jgi:hypothetical protein
MKRFIKALPSALLIALISIQAVPAQTVDEGSARTIGSRRYRRKQWMKVQPAQLPRTGSGQ